MRTEPSACGPTVTTMVVFALAVSCSKSPDEVIEAHRQTAETVLGHLDAIFQSAVEAPAVTAEGLTAPNGSLDFRQWVTVENVHNEYNPHWNARVVFLDQLREGATQSERSSLREGAAARERSNELEPSRWLFQGRALLETGRFAPNESYPTGSVPEDSEDVETVLTELINLEYLLILRPTIETAPSISDSQHYSAGRIQGDALLYDVARERNLGGFRFDVTNMERMSDFRALRSNLTAQVRRALREAIRRLLPNAELPFNSNGSDY